MSSKEYQADWRAKNRERLNEYNRKWRKDNKLRWLSTNRKAYATKLLRKYGITEIPDTCEICAGPPSKGTRRLYVDHDHTTGEFRGFLCRDCNSAVGMMGDSPERLEAAADYIRNSNKVEKAQ